MASGGSSSNSRHREVEACAGSRVGEGRKELMKSRERVGGTNVKVGNNMGIRI